MLNSKTYTQTYVYKSFFGGFVMNLISIMMIAIGLSMDAFAVSVAKGMSLKQDIGKAALKLGFWFGLFQAIMPFLGWFAGSYFQDMISSVDHWIAFILLGAIGINMIREARKEDCDCERDTDMSMQHILLLAIATSIDALAVGISFAFLQVNIYEAMGIIGAITFIFSFAAVYLGNKIGNFCQKYAGILGGCILIIIGTKILIEHIFLN